MVKRLRYIIHIPCHLQHNLYTLPITINAIATGTISSQPKLHKLGKSSLSHLLYFSLCKSLTFPTKFDEIKHNMLNSLSKIDILEVIKNEPKQKMITFSGGQQNVNLFKNITYLTFSFFSVYKIKQKIQTNLCIKYFAIRL